MNIKFEDLNISKTFIKKRLIYVKIYWQSTVLIVLFLVKCLWAHNAVPVKILRKATINTIGESITRRITVSGAPTANPINEFHGPVIKHWNGIYKNQHHGIVQQFRIAPGTGKSIFNGNMFHIYSTLGFTYYFISGWQLAF